MTPVTFNQTNSNIMGFLDNFLGTALGNTPGNNPGNNPAADPKHALFQAAVQMINQHGGIEGLQQKFAGSNLGHVFASWVGTGQNQPISAAQITQVLGHDNVQQAAQQAGVSHGDAAAALAQLLPTIIDKLTPAGTTPTGNSLEQAIGSMLKGGLASLLK